MMILQKNEEGTRSRQIDLLCKQHNTSRMPIASLFHDFTIPKGTIKNILNGNVRLLIDEYLYNIRISTYTFAYAHKKKRCLLFSGKHRFFFISLYYSDNRVPAASTLDHDGPKFIHEAETD